MLSAFCPPSWSRHFCSLKTPFHTSTPPLHCAAVVFHPSLYLFDSVQSAHAHIRRAPIVKYSSSSIVCGLQSSAAWLLAAHWGSRVFVPPGFIVFIGMRHSLMRLNAIKNIWHNVCVASGYMFPFYSLFVVYGLSLL